MKNKEELIYNEVAEMLDRVSFLPVDVTCHNDEYFIKIDYQWEAEYELDGELVPEDSEDWATIWCDIIEKYGFLQYLPDRDWYSGMWYTMELKIDLEAFKKFKRRVKIESLLESE